MICKKKSLLKKNVYKDHPVNILYLINILIIKVKRMARLFKSISIKLTIEAKNKKNVKFTFTSFNLFLYNTKSNFTFIQH